MKRGKYKYVMDNEFDDIFFGNKIMFELILIGIKLICMDGSMIMVRSIMNEWIK